MPSPRFSDRRAVVVALALTLVGVLACMVCGRQIESTRQSLVERRLKTAVDILQEPATRALSEPDARPAFIADLLGWGRVTGLRLTLILEDGSVLVDSELENMPNIGDRPEVAATRDGRDHRAFRRSALTGKDTLYVAKCLVKDGARVGALRVATDASEIDAALSGIEGTFAVLAMCCIGVGAALGLAAGRNIVRKRAATESEPAERIAA